MSEFMENTADRKPCNFPHSSRKSIYYLLVTVYQAARLVLENIAEMSGNA